MYPKLNGSGVDPETQRLRESADGPNPWKRWGVFLPERQWGTVREDYSEDKNCWAHFPHDQARSRAYRWGEDGLLGFCDNRCRVCLAPVLWNGKDTILKERLFGLTNDEGNHGEDVKELYYYLDATPTASYAKALYKYPLAAFPYEQLLRENASRPVSEPEFEVTDSGVFDKRHYVDVFVEYAKAADDDILMRITCVNRSSEQADLHVMPTVWFRNVWSWGCDHEGCGPKPRLYEDQNGNVQLRHEELPAMRFEPGQGPNRRRAKLLFTENETNRRHLYGDEDGPRYAKDAFHSYLVAGDVQAVNPEPRGTKCGAVYRLKIKPGEAATVRVRLRPETEPFGRLDAPADFDAVFAERIREADLFYGSRLPANLSQEERRVARQGYAGLIWTCQFYHYVVPDWLAGDPSIAPVAKRGVRNADWRHLHTRTILSMPDKWEYPWFAAWDLAFHMLPLARIDAGFAKGQLLLLLREWYMHPNGQIPAYEFNFSDVNPPVHAWACWRVYKLTAPKHRRDTQFLAATFQKLLLNFTWWLNRKDPDGRNLFAGGFLGLDNIGVFDRSHALPEGGRLEQADGTAWMAFYCTTMLEMAIELSRREPYYADMASKFFEHFVQISDAMNRIGDDGLWDEEDGFYYDQLDIDGKRIPMRIRSLVGLVPLFAVLVIERNDLEQMPGFGSRMRWFLENRKDLAGNISLMVSGRDHADVRYLLAVPSEERLRRVLRYLFDENEFLSPHGIRSLSKVHEKEPFCFRHKNHAGQVHYVPGESNTYTFGGNSNWRGPVWFPMNYLLIESLERYHYFYGDDFKVEYPTGSGEELTLREIAADLHRRLVSLFLPDKDGVRPVNTGDELHRSDPAFRDLVLFYEYFHGDSGRGCGASHQTGWTALVCRSLERLDSERNRSGGGAGGSRRSAEGSKRG